MKRSSGIRLCVTRAVSALSLSLITGCTDGGSDKAESNTRSSKGGSAQDSSKNTAKAFTAAESKKRILAQGDVDGYRVAAADAPAETNRMATADRKPSAAASTDVEDMSADEVEKALTDSMSVDLTMVGLSSYDGDGAEKAFEAVSDAVTGCTGGFTGTAGGEPQKFTKVSADKTYTVPAAVITAQSAKLK
ncbi:MULTISPECIES: hypothetical protein [unclassified Streptomyces]|uniref:hypothetical protein n=1 Tax=unclassified Streptomyces TaxID=2593676 RepID=UPI00403CB78A